MPKYGTKNWIEHSNLAVTAIYFYSTTYVDSELNYAFNDNLTVTLGAVNVFDEFIDEVGSPNANRLSVGLQYPRRSAANYEGGAWYLRGRYEF